MSAEAAVRSLLLADPALLVLVPAARISLDLVAAATPRPYIVISKEVAATERGLDGSRHARKTSFKLMVVGTDRRNAIAVAEQLELTLEDAGEPSEERSANYDPEIGAEVETVLFDWFD